MLKKFPKKAPTWYKEKNAKTKSASSNMARLGIDVASLQTRCNDTLAKLCQENVRICDTGASTHVTWGNKGTKNIPDIKMYSLGHVGLAMESTAIIDIPRVFVIKDGKKRIQAVLKDCSFDGWHNFNFRSVSKCCTSRAEKYHM
jgi:hypothetical protein